LCSSNSCAQGTRIITNLGEDEMSYIQMFAERFMGPYTIYYRVKEVKKHTYVVEHHGKTAHITVYSPCNLEYFPNKLTIYVF